MSAADLTVVRAGRLIDGSGDAPLADATVVVRGGRIESVLTGDAAARAIESATTVLDHRAHTVLPGLIDSHVHLNLAADATPAEQAVLEPAGALVAASASAASIALSGGITTVRDTGSYRDTAFDLRRAVERGWASGPRMLLCGPPVTITGGHCWFFGGEADGVDGVRRRVRELVKAGADWIKVMGTGGGTPNTRPWMPAYSQDELNAIVDEAHSRERKVTVHCLSSVAIGMAITAGADQIEHAGFAKDGRGASEFDEEMADRMARSGIYVSPTVSVRKFILDHLVDTGGPADAIAGWQRKFDNGMEQFRRLQLAGVNFVTGTDAGWHRTPFDGIAEEMALISECGPSAMDTILSATSRAADHHGLGDQTGRVRAGLSADLIAVDGDPLTDLRSLRNIRLVMSGGTLHTPAR
ncbi:imidazolonepropionase-like amidohydrolase [Conyzicola lurida]|uniref:Imidazolonepropionase-like amidohydrolase n=1 Tax=Conyzicola lurida TaxID=1172621 RepID=A0A841AL16_9MICO|nr:amidohydrolase family protein [Conyzicola lurida]MBB5842165.1 imidazolonepropionase-like amidohydrolase [Conyzicola lurida]